MIADGTVHDKIWQEFYYIFINNMALCNSASSFHIDRKSKQFKMLIKNADSFYFYICFYEDGCEEKLPRA